MLNPIASFCVYWAEMFIAYTYFSGIFEKRFSTIKCILFGLVLFSSGSILNLAFSNNTTINLFSFLLTTTIFATFCFRGKAVQRLFYSFVLIVINAALEAVIISLSTYVTGTAFLDYNNNLLLFLFEAISSKGVYFLIVLVFIKMVGAKKNASKVPAYFLIYPLASTFCLFVFWHICAQPWCSSQIQLLMAITGGGLFLSSVLLFITYSQQVEKESEAMQMRSELTRLQTEQSYYQILDQQNQQLMIYAHDAKKHLAAIQALNEDPRISNYVEELSMQLNEHTKNCHSGNKLLDVMLNKYTIDCKMRGIRFEYDVKVCNLVQLEDIDLVAILGNLLDNAVTAAEKSKEKTISISTVRRNSYSVIILTNSCDTPPRCSGNRLISTKSDPGSHGFGIRSVEKAIRKYLGDYEWEYNTEKQLFTITVMLMEQPRTTA